MLKTLLSLSAAVALVVAVSSAEALPLSNVDGASSSPHLTLVYGGCGPYGHRGPWGGCRRGGQWSGPYWRGPGWRFYNGCWRGPYGRLHCN